MNAEILTIGDELLIGQVIDTNSAWLGQQLNLIGIDVVRSTSIRDRREDILLAIADSLDRVDLIIMTGGLGPTKDDITKHTLCEFFNSPLVMNEAVLARIKENFESRGITMLEGNVHQAMLPEKCIVVDNHLGTASGMWFEQERKVVLSMPGVPHEMKGMMTSVLLPKLAQRYSDGVILHRTILTFGIGESMLAKKMEHWENDLSSSGIKLAYLPAPGMVRLRMTLHGLNKEELAKTLQEAEERLTPLISDYIIGYEDDNLEKIVGKLLIKAESSLGVAESCTGGYISHLITSVPGSSRYFRGSLVPYLIEIKGKTGLVNPATLEKYGAVSEETAKEMASGILGLMGSTFSVSTTGIAGPDGGTEEIPVGTVWIGIGSPLGIKAQKFTFGKNRERNIQMASQTALNLLRKEILKTFAQD